MSLSFNENYLLLASQPRSLLVSSLSLCEMFASFASTLNNHLEQNSKIGTAWFYY